MNSKMQVIPNIERRC